ncbi:hypothetical protein Dimus_002788, partial [Dionaea muscipula]
KEFYARLTLSHYKKKEVARSSVRGVEIEFDHLKLASILGVPGNNGISEEVNEEEEEQNQLDFDWEAVNDEATLQGESGSDDQFFDAQVEDEAPTIPAFPASPGNSTNVQKEPVIAGVDPSGPSGHILVSVMNQLQEEFERARANRIQANLEKAQAENARLLALLQQAQSQSKP